MASRFDFARLKLLGESIEPVTPEQAERLYHDCSLNELCRRAGKITDRIHGPKVRTYAVERNINYTNICRTACSFCAFSVPPGCSDPPGYTLGIDEICAKIQPLVDLGGTQILLQGGMNPELGLDWYQNLLSRIKQRFPKLHIHGFSPAEIAFLADHLEIGLSQLLGHLRDAGLDSIPGGGAEILVDAVRKAISPAKCSTQQWLAVNRLAHRMGIYTTATMMFGHVETVAQRIEHLKQLRDLQSQSLAYREKTGRGACFTAFICWPFQPGNSPLGRRVDQLYTADAVQQLRMTALARIFLNNIPNIQASWVTQGPKIAQISLLAGCNDAGSLMMEENVVAAAGTSYMLELESLRRLIQNAGFKPTQRDFYYQTISN